MRLEAKRTLDYWVGRPLLSILQGMAWLLGLFLRRNHAIAPVRCVLFVKFQGVGSLVICKPALAAFRRSHPGVRCLFWGTPALAAVATHMPEFDEMLLLDDRSAFSALRTTFGALVRLWRERVDWAFDLEVYSRLSSALLTLTCARNRAGFALEQLRSRRVHTHLVYFNRYHYVGDAYARLIGQILPAGQNVDPNDHGSWRFALTPLEALPRPYFVFNIHAGDLAFERRWPLESFRSVVDALLERVPDATAVLIGHGESEVRYSALLRGHPRLLDLSGKLTLAETIRTMAHAELVVTNDSGPLHLALATSAPVVALFGPTRGETYLPPERERLIALQESIYCSPCVHHWEPPPCGGDNQCMKRLSVARVLAACDSLLGLPARATTVPDVPVATDYYPGLVYTRVTRLRSRPG